VYTPRKEVVLMATLPERRTGMGSSSRTRWLVILGIVVAAVIVAVVLIMTLSGGGGGGGGGGY
jgi:hypothetical protein